MRTNIVLDKDLIEEAFKYAGVKTKKDLIRIALQEYIENHKRKDLLEIKGKVKIDESYDHKKLREGA